LICASKSFWARSIQEYANCLCHCVWNAELFPY